MPVTYEFAHVGINCNSPDMAADLSVAFSAAFGFQVHELPNSLFVTGNMEILKAPASGEKGHIGLYTNDIQAAIQDLEAKGFQVAMDSASYNGDNMVSVYLSQSFGGFAVHLLSKTR